MFPGGTDLKDWLEVCSAPLLEEFGGSVGGTWGEEQGALEVTSWGRRGQRSQTPMCQLQFLHLPRNSVPFLISADICSADKRGSVTSVLCHR